DFLTSNIVWLATDRPRDVHCVYAFVYITLVFFFKQKTAYEIVLRLLVVRGEIERGLEAAHGIRRRALLEEHQSEVHAQRRIRGVVLDQRTVDLLRPGQLADLEQRKHEQVARPLVVRLVAQRVLQRDARIGGIALREGLRAPRARALGFRVPGQT